MPRMGTVGCSDEEAGQAKITTHCPERLENGSRTVLGDWIEGSRPAVTDEHGRSPPVAT